MFTSEVSTQPGHARRGDRIRLTHLPPRGWILLSGHHNALRSLLLKSQGKWVREIHIDAFADRDQGVGNRRAEAAEKALIEIAQGLNIDVRGRINRTAFDKSAASRVKPGKDAAYWRSVDVYVDAIASAAPVPTPQPMPGNAPPCPGNRHMDWEVYGVWGVSFDIDPIPGIPVGAVIGLDVFHFRRKGNHGDAAWFVSPTFGGHANLSAASALSRATKNTKMVKRLVSKLGRAGLTQLKRTIVRSGIPRAAQHWLFDLFEAFGTMALPEAGESYASCNCVVPVNLRALEGATLSKAGVEGGAVAFSYGAGKIKITTKGAHAHAYQLVGSGRNAMWVNKNTAFKTITLMDDIDAGGWGAGFEGMPDASGTFAGGPLLRM